MFEARTPEALIEHMSSGSQGSTSPEGLSGMLPHRPLFSIGDESPSGAIVQHYRHPAGSLSIALPPLRDHLLVVNLCGHILIEDTTPYRRRERRWAGSGQMTLMPAGTKASRTYKGNTEVLLIHLPEKLVIQTANECGFSQQESILVSRFAVTDNVVGRLAQLLLVTASESDSGTSQMIFALIRAIVIHLLRRHSVSSKGKEAAPSSMSSGKLQRVVAFMETHMDQNLPLSRLVELSGLSSSQFTRTFRAAMGKPPHGYLIDLRIERARNLLETTDLSVIEVGMQSGFAQPTHFATMFRKLVGLSPREWRAARRI